MRYQLPAWSPVTLGALAAGISPHRDAPVRLAGRIASEYGAARVVLTGSGTDALALALRAAAPAGRRPRVALPGWACYDLMTAADTVDAEVVLYDLIPETLSPDPGSLRQALAAGLHAVVVAHWFGLPVDLASLEPMIRAAGATVIDDAAQGVGASIRGRPLGAGGEYGILSFGRGKGRTGGAGGAVMAFGGGAAEALARTEEALGASGSGAGSVVALAAQWALGRPWLYGIPAHLPGLHLGETTYHPAEPPSRMAPRNAAIIDRLWSTSSKEADTRRLNAERWRTALAGIEDLQSCRAFEESSPGWLRYPVLASPRIKLILQRGLARRHGVMPGYPKVLGDLPVSSRRWAGGPVQVPMARVLADRLFTLPTHRRVKHFEMEIIRRCVHQEQ